MDDLLKAAGQLGKLIAAQAPFQRLRDAEAAVRNDAGTKKLLDDFERQREKIEQMESERKPVSVEDKHEMKRLSDAVHGSEELQSLVRAQADYMELMNKVNDAIRTAIQ
jgi:cell fate (sporulation/competence/biofilm development) regulator YlbF (YheA/YmcA/DUF963 family)